MSIRGYTYILYNTKVLYDHQDVKILFISTREANFLFKVVVHSKWLLYGNVKVQTSWVRVYASEFLSLI